ncbi:hypothetical protein [Thalassomonas haliotis]|uniref:Uncharacterized protein n=1 Tax=Thalassomonas haliotis TaxID=485448 RepID=A0ABY7VE82_9GAMM|nr:hypothetical protein [Thalassomonas haliotis]WDE12020.1 hypothetical protein H3N35_00570 [Thalassomonas haliotis]
MTKQQLRTRQSPKRRKMLVANNSPGRDFIMPMSVKPYHIRFIRAGVSAPIVPESAKGKRLMRVEASPCVFGHLPKVKVLSKHSYVMVCQQVQCNCPGQSGVTAQKSYAEAILEWNKFTPVYSTRDLFHPTVRVKGLPLKEVRLNLQVEWMFINKFLASFSRDDLMADDREVFIIREKWLALLRHQLHLLEAAGAATSPPARVKTLAKQTGQEHSRPMVGPLLSKALA